MSKSVRPEWIYGPETRRTSITRYVISAAVAVIVALGLVLVSACKSDANPAPTPGPVALVAASASLTGDAKTLPAKAPKDFCATLDTRDMALCRLIESHPAYGTAGPDGDEGESPNGKAIIREIASQNLPKGEVRMYLEGEYEAYTYHFRGSSISMDVRNLPNPDCHFELGWKDKDGKPGGLKLVETKVVCP